MTYEEYKKQKLNNSNLTLQKNSDTTSLANNRYEEYKNSKINTNTSPTNTQAQTKAYNTLLNATNVSTYNEMQPQSIKTLPKINIPTAGDTESLKTEKYQEIIDRNGNNVLKGSVKALGANALDATVDTGQFFKNAFKSEMKKEEREAIESLIKLENGFRGKANQLSEQQAKLMADNIRKKHGLEGLTVQQLQDRLNGIVDWTYKENALEKASTDMVNKVNEENAKLSKGEQFVTNAFGTVGRMGPTIVSNIALPGSGTATMFTSTAQAQTEDLMNQGVDYRDAVVNGILSGAMETGTEMLSGGLSQKLTGIPALSKISKYTDNIANPIARGVLNVGGDVISEGLEEVASTAIQPFIDRVTYNPNAQLATGEEMWSSFTQSILPTLLMQGGSVAVQKVNEYSNAQKQAIENSNMPQTTKEQMIQALEQQKEKISAQIQAQLNQNTTQNNTNIAQTTPNTENISQNNVQNVSNLENTVQNTNDIEKSNNTIYNQAGGVENEPIQRERMLGDNNEQTGIYENGEQEQINKYTREQYAKFEQSIKPIATEKLTNDEQNLIKEYKNKYNKDIVLFENDSDYGGGASLLNSSKIYIDMNTAKEFGYKRIATHEVLESDILHDNSVKSIMQSAINDIINDSNFQNQKIEFWDSQDGEIPSDYLIAKDIICDRFAEIENNERNDYKNVLSENTNRIIDSAINEYKKVKDSTQGSFLMPSNEQLQAQDKQETEEAYNTLNMKKINNKNPNFMLVDEKDSYKRNMFNNNAKAINDLIKAKNNSIKEIDTKIKNKENELNSKKDKTTKIAQNIQRQIINLEKRKADVEQEYIKKIDRLENRNANINKLKKQVSENRIPTRKEIKEKIITEKDLDSYNFDDVKEISKFKMNNTTPERVMEKIFDRETAMDLNTNFIKPIKHNEAERIRFMNTERQEIENLGIKPKSAESSAVQKYGEGVVVNETTGEETEYTLKDLQTEFPNDWEKIKNASEVIRNKYDTYLDAINQVLNENGYDSIPKLKNYFRHFEAITNLFDKMGIPTKENLLPTDLNGLTMDLKPGKNFFANALSRTGKKTTYDAITGIDGYLEGASKMIYHTEDIQKLRALEDYLRKKYGSQTDLSNLQGDEFNTRVEQIQNNHLSEFVAWLNEYTDNLAGKKTKLDRGLEEGVGRKVYGTLNFLKKQVGSNLTGLNINSALSNFISITQSASKTSKVAMAQGLGDTFKNIFSNDGFINKSDFLTRRFGSDKLSKTWWEKASNAGQIFMSGTDYFSANLITRSKYYEYLNKGYPEAEAMKKADEFADRLMGGRALGDMPNIFNSKTLGIITQFQLENVNQFDSIFHDTMYENRAEEQTQYEAKTWNEKIKSNLAKSNPKFYNGLTATFILGQLFTYAWLFNKADEELTGSAGAFDPFGLIEKTIKDFTNPDITKEQATKNLIKNIIDQIPYANIVTGGGRVTMTDALPNIDKLLSGESGWEEVAWKLLNLGLPTGGGQIRKSIQGAMVLAKGGDYTSDGRLKFPIAQEENKFLEGAQALLFGKWATPGGQKYIEDGFKPLSKVQTEGLEKAKELDISIKEFYDVMEKIKDIEVPTRKNKEGKDESIPGARKKLIIDELNKTDLNDKQKKLMYDIFYKQEIK